MNWLIGLIFSSESVTMSLVRKALVAGIALLAQRGIVTGSDGEQLLAALMGVAVVVWSILSKKNAKTASADLVASSMSPKVGPPTAGAGRLRMAGLLLLFTVHCSLFTILLASTGCMTSAGVGKYNRIAADKVLQIKAEKGGALVGVDLLAINSGLFAAFDAAPIEMSVRVLGDTALTAAAAWGTYKVGDQAGWWGSDNSDHSASTTTSDTHADDHTINGHSIVVRGNGNTINVGDPITTTLSGD